MATQHQPSMIEVDLGAGIRAGFSTRNGGVSIGPWSSLNLGEGVGDDPVRVTENRRRVAAWAGGDLFWGRQVHGTAVRVLGADGDFDTADCDAVVTTRPKTGVAVVVADCVPLLLADPDARVAAAVHAGRRGLFAGVVESALEVLFQLGADPTRVRAAIGPCIRGAHYEVPATMRDEGAARLPATACLTIDGKPGLDLPAGVRHILKVAGVTTVTDTGLDTAVDERFYSHRRAGRSDTVAGRFSGVIALEDR